MAEGELEPGDPVDWQEVRTEAVRRFGITRFRPGQRELIENALSRRDSLGILPTGAGKSLCYQLPALFLKGAVVVVSPLIALMQDQQDHLEDAEIESARLDSTVTAHDQQEQEREIRRGSHDIVLLTPERLQNPDNVEPLKRRGVALFVVDEAHCVSQWGHDFRPAYLELRHVIEALGHPTVLALTATAPPDRVDDILQSLGIPDARVVRGGIERDNLFFEVFRTVNREEKQQRLLEIISVANGPGIVYAATVRCVVELHEWLVAQGIDAVRYHGQLPASEREASQERFMNGACKVIVATNAFGLGVDKADVRFVVHWHFPDSVESYYQEAGRAGRDGKPARCALLYKLEDKRVRSFFIGGKHPRSEDVKRVLQALGRASAADREVTIAELARESALGERRVSTIADALENMHVLARRAHRLRVRRAMEAGDMERVFAGFEARYEADRERLRVMMRYGETTLCRMQYIREYFGEPPGELCNHCDNCKAPQVEIDTFARKAALRAHRRTRETERSPDRASVIPVDAVATAARDHAAPVSSTSPDSRAAGAAATFARGQKVRHATFGTGEVVEARGDELTVAFVRGGERRVLAAYLERA